MPGTSDMPIFSLPIGIAFGEEQYAPWTIGLHRYRYYNAPRIELAIPEEVRVGKFAEVYLQAYEDRQFFERKLFLIRLLSNFVFISSTISPW